ncbi:MAG: RagB/SusD family nutrient uptake outer membrane protein [Gemmatimonadaceae bacterium]
MTRLQHKPETVTMRFLRTLACGAVMLTGLAACDTKVTNPGPVQDAFLADRNAASAMVNGSGRALSSGLNWISYTGAAVAREIHPAGSTGSFGITNRWQNGELAEDDVDLNTHWEQAQRARWQAEESIRRLEAAGPPPAGSLQTPAQYYNLLQLAYIYAGFANRMLGENMCEAVFDGSPIKPNAAYFQRAESLFTKAIAVTGGTPATIASQANAAYGGRAGSRVFLDKWNEAVADAGLVPIGFVFNMAYFNIGDDDQRNRIAWAMGNTPYRAHTQWSTWYLDYKTATPDPRVPITTTTLLGDAAIECCGRVPFLPEGKHTVSASPIRLTSGREMRLIEAEAKLKNNDLTGALTAMNLVRSNAGTSAITATTVTEGWRLLKRERGIELWLEARRLGDMRRWKAANTPGALDPLELPGTASHLQKQDLCFPVSRSERQTNPNIPG